VKYDITNKVEHTLTNIAAGVWFRIFRLPPISSQMPNATAASSVRYRAASQIVSNTRPSLPITFFAAPPFEHKRASLKTYAAVKAFITGNTVMTFYCFKFRDRHRHRASAFTAFAVYAGLRVPDQFEQPDMGECARKAGAAANIFTEWPFYQNSQQHPK